MEQNAVDSSLALGWLSDGLAEVIYEAGVATKTVLHEPGGMVFVGFRSVTPEDKRRLSFKDEPPPWLFAIACDFRAPGAVAKMRPFMDRVAERLRAVRCKEHGQAAHILFHGRGSEQFDIQIASCCEEFSRCTHTMLVEAKMIKADEGKEIRFTSHRRKHEEFVF